MKSLCCNAKIILWPSGVLLDKDITITSEQSYWCDKCNTLYGPLLELQ